jgi:hypothetical protein
MTTPRDLVIISFGVAPSRPLEQGDLSLALAGAELVDLLADGIVTLDGLHIAHIHGATLSDGLLEQAAASLAREAPYESVVDWLWRRGRDLAPAYLAALEADGQLAPRRRRWIPFPTGQLELVNSPEGRRALDRWEAREPVLAALAAAVGIGSQEARFSDGADDSVETVLGAVHDAVRELEAVRQRRAIEQAAFDNVWRGG